MKKLLILLLALLAIATIAYFCVYKTQVPAIEKDIQARAQAALSSQGLSSVDATVDGRNITLSGIAPSQEVKQLAGQIAQVNGYNLVDNQIKAPGEALDGEGLADSMPRNHSLGIALDEAGKVSIDGILDADSHKALRAAAIDKYGEANVQDRILDLDIPVAEGMPDVAIATLEKLGDLTSGDAVIIGNKVDIKGVGASEDVLAQVKDQLKDKIPENYEVDLDLAVAQGAASEPSNPTASDPTAESAPVVSQSDPATESPDSAAKPDAGEPPSVADKSDPTGSQPVIDSSKPASGSSDPVGQAVMPVSVIAKNVQPKPSEKPKAEKKAKKASVADVRRCQRQFNRVLRKSKVSFNSSSATIKRSSYRTLNQLASIAKKCSGMKISIHGHTDSTGRNKLNKRLSKKRARRIATYLANKGVPAKHLVSIGHGSSRPIASNKTTKGRARNRRIEFTVKR